LHVIVFTPNIEKIFYGQKRLEIGKILKYKFGQRSFWWRSYHVDTVGSMRRNSYEPW